MKNSVILSSLYLGYIDEQFYPEILSYDWNSVNFFKEILVYQNELIFTTYPILRMNFISIILKELEVTRILGVLKSYHRNRIWKIENFLTKKNKTTNLISKLSKAEEYFTFSYKKLLSSHQSLIFYDFNIKNLRSSKLDSNKTKLPLMFKEDFLFFHLFEKIKNHEETLLEKIFNFKLKTNTTFCMKYFSIKYLLFSKVLCLV